MATNRTEGSRGRAARVAGRVRKSAKAGRCPQLPPPPDDYPVFPDTSTWPVVFPDLPASPGGGPRRPPQHTSKESAPLIPADQLPNHVAVVMDGNGRWATQRGLGRTEGHKMGEAVLIDITCGAIEIGIKWLTVYAFSTENWKRSTEEVRFLMGFNREVVRRRRENLNAMGVRMRWVGSRPKMWRSVIKEFEIAESMTTGNEVITINYCVNYGGRTEIAEAAKDIALEAVAGRLNPNRITESTIARHLHRPDMPDVDLLIRTSGEQRSSNFMLWQAAYAEYIFQDKLWPDYDRRDLWAACEEYAERNRRFGRA
ncbi:MAG TPA: decaprenyl diphosphate synthase [Mycobacterium sp.]|nr:decaprenyl diphosphate synthase [Mycobacterium sp.]